MNIYKTNRRLSKLAIGAHGSEVCPLPIPGTLSTELFFSRKKSNKASKQRALGFTLIELLIAMIIIGILTSIAYPAYLNYLNQSRRSDAMGGLSQLQLTFERCYSQNFSYSTACGALPTFPFTSQQGFYTITLANLTASTYTLTATAVGRQANDTTCATMSVNQANVKTAFDNTGTAQTKCWNP